MQIECPWCGRRSEEEFRCGGQSHIVRPAPPAGAGDEDWAAYLYLRDNPRGVQRERWHHRYGCGQWFNVARHLETHEIIAVYPMGETGPAPVPGEDA